MLLKIYSLMEPLRRKLSSPGARKVQQLLSGWIVCSIVPETAIALEQAHALTGLDVVRATYGLRGEGHTVAIIDSGIAYDHVAFGGGFGPGNRIVAGTDISGGDDDPYDEAGTWGGHGTQVSGIIGAATGGIDGGVAPGVDLVVIRVIGDEGESYFTWIEQALSWINQHRLSFSSPITTVNISNGALWNGLEPPEWATLEEELETLTDSGLFISASAGNDFADFGEAGLSYPAVSPHVVASMSVDNGTQLSYFSQRSPSAIAAPGRWLRTTVPDYEGNNDGVVDDFRSLSGTDLAAPYLAGASVLVREAMNLAGWSDINQQAIYGHLRNTSDPIFDPITSQEYRLLNLARAIEEIMPPDDVGSSFAEASDVGMIGPPQVISGLVGKIDDIDFFSFTASRNGMLTILSETTHYLDPHWTVFDSAENVIFELEGSSFTFPVVNGGRYWLAISTTDAVGYYEANLSVTSDLVGDFNNDHVVDIADYIVWRDSLGSTVLLTADADFSGAVDEADFGHWTQAFGNSMGEDLLVHLVPEPTTILLLALVGLQFFGYRFGFRSWHIPLL